MNAFSDLLDSYCARIAAREPMVMYRFGDGERLLMNGSPVGAHTQASRVDRWQASAGLTALGRDLATVLHDGQGPHAHFGISCPCCDEASFQFYDDAIKDSPTFTANLFINGNYRRWRAFLERLGESGPVAVVLNERATTTEMPFDPTAVMIVPDDCVVRYESGRERYAAYARAFARSLPERSCVLVAAGPMSEPLIHFMWNESPQHTYVDVGSSLDEMTHGVRTRPYMDPESTYACKECVLPEPSIRMFDPHPWAARFFRRSDPHVTRVFVDVPAEWWSRGHEYAWCTGFAEPGQVVLDAACGLSHPFKMWLADRGCKTYACDLDPAILDPEKILSEVRLHLGAAAEEQTREILPRIRFDQANLAGLPYEDRVFDRVFCISVLEHVGSAERRACLDELRRVLKPRGLLAVTMDVPPIDPLVFAADVAASGLAFAADVDPVEPPDALVGTPRGYGTLRCFRALLRRAPIARVSIVINTACADPEVAGRRNEYRSASYSTRAELLRKHVLPACAMFDEIIVAGIFPPELRAEFPHVRFVEVPPVRRDRWDALHQRDMGARYATGDIIVFCHDDHAPGETLATYLRAMPETTDILVPQRIHMKTRQPLINGRERAGLPPYMGGHCYAMRRWIWAALPLTVAPDEYWDVVLTPMWQELGARIVWDDSVVHYDCEALESEA